MQRTFTKILFLTLASIVSLSLFSQTTRNAGTFTELNTAVGASVAGDIINITANITSSAGISLNKSLIIKGNGFTISAPNPGLLENGALETATTAYRLFTISGSGVEVTMENLTLMGGNFSGQGSAISNASKLTLKKCTITRSQASSGGGIFNTGNLIIENSYFARNAAQYGGGLLNSGSNAQAFLDGVSMVENRSLSSSGGGGAVENNNGATIIFNNSTLSNNQSTEIGGAVNNYSGTVYFVNSTATGNVAFGGLATGGAIGNNGGQVFLVNSLFAYNYKRTTGDVNNPMTYQLDDFAPYSNPGGIKSYYTYFHAPLPAGLGQNTNNIKYNGAQDGSDDGIFSGGLKTRITDNNGYEIGDSIYRPLLFRYEDVVIAPLKFGSLALEAANRGTRTRVSLPVPQAEVSCSETFDISLFTRNGTARVFGNEVVLTEARFNQAGSIWANDRLDLRYDFTVEADVNLGTIDARGADGIAFVLQPLSSNAGSTGGGLGYAGIRPSVAIEYDTWKNGGDPEPQDHTALMTNGNTGAHTNLVALGNIEDGRWRSVKIEWNAATKTLTHTFDGRLMFNQVGYDMVANIFSGNPYVYWGFTAATGGAVNKQQVRFKKYCLVNESTKPVVSFYNGYSYQNLAGSSQPGQEVLKDQTGFARPDPPARGTLERVIPDLAMLKVVYDPASKLLPAAGGKYTGGTIYGDVYLKGTKVRVNAIPDANYEFKKWTYLEGRPSSNPARTTFSSVANDTVRTNPFELVLDRNITLYPTFESCGCGCNVTDGGVIGVNQIIDAGAPASTINNVTAASIASGTIQYKWQYSIVSATEGFRDTSLAAGSPTLEPGSPSVTTWYRRISRNACKSTGDAADMAAPWISSNVVEIKVNKLFQAPGGGPVSCLNNPFIPLDDECGAIITSAAVTLPAFEGQYIYMDANYIPSSFPLNAISESDTFAGEGTWMYGLYSNTPDEKGLHQLICWGFFTSSDVSTPTLVGHETGIADNPSTVIDERYFQQWGALREMDFLTWRGDLDADDNFFRPGQWSCWQSTNHPGSAFTWPNDAAKTYDTMRIKPAFTGYLSMIAASKLNTNEDATKANFDPVVAVYADSFDPENPCQNLIGFGESSFIPNQLAGLGFAGGLTDGPLSGAQQAARNFFAPWMLHDQPIVRMDVKVQQGKEYVVVVSHREFTNVGSITPEGTPPVSSTDAHFAIRIDSAQVGIGEEICVPFKVQDFDSIVSAQFSIKYDPLVLQFVGIQTSALNPLGVDAQNFVTPANGSEPGVLEFNWNAGSLTSGVSLSLNDTMFYLCFSGVGNGKSLVRLSDSPLPFVVRDSAGYFEPFVTTPSEITVGTGQKDRDLDRVSNGAFELYFLRNDYSNGGSITNNATNILTDLEDNLLYDTSFSFFDFLCFDFDEIYVTQMRTKYQDTYTGGTIKQLDLKLGGEGKLNFNGIGLDSVGRRWQALASALLSKPGRDTSLLDINILNFGQGSKDAARKFASELVLDYGFMPLAVENCGAYQVNITDSYEVFGDCGIDQGGFDAQPDGSNIARIITRTYIIKDFSFRQNTDTAKIQMIFRNPNMGDVRLPHYTVNIECDQLGNEVHLLDNGLPSPRTTGYPFIPTLTGFVDLTPNQAVCNISAAYEDKAVVTNCANNKEFRREWTIYDWCRPGTTVVYHQLIRMGDFTAPVINETTTSLTTNFVADACSGGVTITRGSAQDLCGSLSMGVKLINIQGATIAFSPQNLSAQGQKTNSGTYGTVTQIPGITASVNAQGAMEVRGLGEGKYYVEWEAKDACGNASTERDSFTITDNISPSCVIDDLRTITLTDFQVGGNGGNANPRGEAYLTADRLDEGSWDNCHEVSVQIRRMTPTGMTGWADQVGFTCADEGDSVLVEMVARAGADSTICWTYIKVEDKTIPECREIGTVTMLCSDLPAGDLSENSSVWNQFFADSITVTKTSVRQLCNIEFDANIETEVKIDQCGYGWVNRYYRVYRNIDNKEFADTCRMSIVFSEDHDYWVTFPADEANKECGSLEEVKVNYHEGGCDLITISKNDQKFDATADECYKIFRTYRVINWCEYDGAEQPIVVQRQDWNRDGVVGDATTVNVKYRQGVQHVYKDYKGRFVTVVGATGSLNPTGDPQTDADLRDTVYRVGVEARGTDTVYWETSAPQALSASAKNQRIYSSNPPIIPGLEEAILQNGYNPQGFFEYIQHLKVFDNEAPEIEVLTEDLNFASYSNDSENGCPGAVSIAVKVSDDCTSNLSELVVRDVLLDRDNNNSTGSITFLNKKYDASTSQGTTLYKAEYAGGTLTISSTGLPVGEHKFMVVASDGCGNVQTKDIVFEVEDKKGPAPICIEGFAVELMPTTTGSAGMAVVNAVDFVVNTLIEDCHDDSGVYLITRMRNADGSTKTAAQVVATVATETSLTLTCADRALNQPIQVAIIATDGVGNKDYCVTTITVQDNVTPCGEGAMVNGLITTENSTAIPQVEVKINMAGLQDEVGLKMTDTEGSYRIFGLTNGMDYSVLASKEDMAVNGLSTYDIILITKHLLGEKLLDSPYKMIAADVNNSKSISTLDIIYLRKVLLGTDNQFANNKVWRFIPADYQFPNPANPWQSVFPEVLNINDLTGEVRGDFIGIKTGDINGSAILDLQPRTNASFTLDVNEAKLGAGQEVEVDFTAPVQTIDGFQMTLELGNLELVEIKEGILKKESFGTKYLKEGKLLISWAKGNAVNLSGSLFGLVLRSPSNVVLSEVMKVSGQELKGESYDVEGNANGLGLRFNQVEPIFNGFHLYQNMPNPFGEETLIRFSLPDDGKAVVTFNDVTGRVLKVVKGDFVKGLNQISVSRTDLPSGGVYYYTLKFAEYSSTQKMVLISK